MFSTIWESSRFLSVADINVPLKMEAFSDTDWGANLDSRKSQSGSMFFLGQNIIHWSSTQQSLVALQLPKQKSTQPWIADDFVDSVEHVEDAVHHCMKVGAPRWRWEACEHAGCECDVRSWCISYMHDWADKRAIKRMLYCRELLSLSLLWWESALRFGLQLGWSWKDRWRRCASCQWHLLLPEYLGMPMLDVGVPLSSSSAILSFLQWIDFFLCAGLENFEVLHWL